MQVNLTLRALLILQVDWVIDNVCPSFGSKQSVSWRVEQAIPLQALLDDAPSHACELAVLGKPWHHQTHTVQALCTPIDAAPHLALLLCSVRTS